MWCAPGGGRRRIVLLGGWRRGRCGVVAAVGQLGSAHGRRSSDRERHRYLQHGRDQVVLLLRLAWRFLAVSDTSPSLRTAGKSRRRSTAGGNRHRGGEPVPGAVEPGSTAPWPHCRRWIERRHHGLGGCVRNAGGGHLLPNLGSDVAARGCVRAGQGIEHHAGEGVEIARRAEGLAVPQLGSDVAGGSSRRPGRL
jgi:hypothetical protein